MFKVDAQPFAGRRNVTVNAKTLASVNKSQACVNFLATQTCSKNVDIHIFLQHVYNLAYVLSDCRRVAQL